MQNSLRPGIDEPGRPGHGAGGCPGRAELRPRFSSVGQVREREALLRHLNGHCDAACGLARESQTT